LAFGFISPNAMLIYTIMSPSLTSIYTGMTSITSMLIYRQIRPVNRIRTSIGMRSSFIHTRITRTFTIATGTEYQQGSIAGV
jgi:hypothetical protein